jgi:effector-binding domain-containing protein
MPLSEPTFINRDPQPYAALKFAVPQQDIPQVAPPKIQEILAWAGEHGQPAGPVFFNYTSMQPGRPMDMEVGVPLAKVVPGDAKVETGTLPGGRYVSVTWTGPYDKLHEAHDSLHRWLKQQKLPLQDGGEGTTLLEIYHTDPGEEPDPQTFVTEIAFKISD